MPEMKRSERALIIIGGHEDKEDKKLILRAVAERVGDGKLVVATVASQQQEELWILFTKRISMYYLAQFVRNVNLQITIHETTVIFSNFNCRHTNWLLQYT